MSILKGIGGFLAGLVVAFILVNVVELYSMLVHPFPEGIEMTMDEICAHAERYPGWVLATIVPMWGALTFASVRLAAWIGGLWGAIPLGVLLLAAVGFNQWMVPYPLWFEVANFIVLPLAIGAATWMRPAPKAAQ